MLLWIIRPLRYLLSAISPHDSPRQLALGMAIGIAVGLVPKGNLTAVMLTTVLFGSQVNAGTGMLTAFCFSWIGSFLDPLTHRIGLAVLGCGPIRSMLATLYDLPLVPWTGWNNTVVVGSLLLGCGQVYFSYRLSLPLFETYHPQLVARLRRLRRQPAATEPAPAIERRAA